MKEIAQGEPIAIERPVAAHVWVSFRPPLPRCFLLPRDQVAGRVANASPRFYIAQAMRASLLAKRHGGLVVAAEPLELQCPGAQPIGRRRRLGLGVPQHRSRPMNQEHAQVAVTPLANGAQVAARSRTSITRGVSPRSMLSLAVHE